MTNNIFNDFEENRDHTIELLDGISSAVSLFTVSSEIKFIHFNKAAEDLLGYGSGQLLHLVKEDPMKIFHPDHVDNILDKIIAAMIQGHMFNYDCQLLCADGSYKWANIAARLVQHRNSTLYYQSVLTPIKEPENIMLQGFHGLIAMGDKDESSLLTQLIEHYGGTCEAGSRGLEALEKFEASDDCYYQCIFIGCRMKDINGLELAKDIRHCGHPQAASIPILLMADETDSENVQEAGDIGVTAYLRKPLSPKKIKTWLKSLNK